jgi:DNA excision repair protein ERCC-4
MGASGMKIIVDSREQTPLTFTRFDSERGTLQSGDYSIAGLTHRFAVERKSIPDLVQSVTRERERFERELHRLRGFDFARLLIVGTEADVRAGNYRSEATPKSVLHSLHAFEVRYGIPVVWADTEALAATLIERWAFWHVRELQKLLDTASKFALTPS